jgi:hypothetical protein
MKNNSRVLTSILAFLAFVSCENNDANTAITCTGTEILFATEVSPIIKTSCATNSSCHASGSTRGPGALTNYAQIFSAKAEIKSAVNSGRMPEGSTLTSNQKTAIICWIENGAINN